MVFAGSAIAQKITFESISPSDAKWFLLSGATDPPSAIDITARRHRDCRGDKSGAFLKGITRDFVYSLLGNYLGQAQNLFIVKEIERNTPLLMDIMKSHIQISSRVT